MMLRQKISFIRRGSQVDWLIFTPEVEILTHTGAQVYSGQTPVERWTKQEGTHAL